MQHRALHVACLVFALHALYASAARAQLTPLAFTQGMEVAKDGRAIDNAPVVRPTADDCERDVAWQFHVQYPSPVPVLEAWVGSAGIDCALTESRELRGAQTATRCRRLAEPIVSRRDATFSVTSTRLLAGAAAPDTAGCVPVAGTQTFTVFVLPLEQETVPSANLVSPPLAGLSVQRAVLTPFTIRPEPPRKVTALPGEHELAVSYDRDAAEQLPGTHYVAYFDFGEGGIPCGSGLLEPDAAGVTHTPARDAPTLSVREGDGDRVSLDGLDELRIALGQEVAVSVARVDPAGNESAPSSLVCVKRVDVAPPTEWCMKDSSCKRGLTTCSTARSVPGSAGAAIAVLIALVGLVRRRLLRG